MLVITTMTAVAGLDSGSEWTHVNTLLGQESDERSEALVVELFERWNSSLASGDAEAVVANYSSDAVLHPTLSPIMRTTHAEIRDYFDQFLHRQPSGEVTSRSIYYGAGVVVDTGLATFRFGDGSSVPVRYTFVYVLEDGQWRIKSHHSSRVVEAAPDGSSG